MSDERGAELKGGRTSTKPLTEWSRTYTYDRVGNRQTLENLDGQDSKDYDYQYNGLGQLEYVYSPIETPSSRNRHEYDANGNMTKKHEEHRTGGN